MILIDHNIAKDQAEQLRSWGIPFKQIGYEVGRPEWQDQQEILRHLHRLKRATFFTRDLGFFSSRLRHENHCIVVVTGSVMDTAAFIRKLLRHRAFRTKGKRSGKIIRVAATNIAWWEAGKEKAQHMLW